MQMPREIFEEIVAAYLEAAAASILDCVANVYCLPYVWNGNGRCDHHMEGR